MVPETQAAPMLSVRKGKSVFGLIPLTCLVSAFTLTALPLTPHSLWLMLLFAGLCASYSVTFLLKQFFEILLLL